MLRNPLTHFLCYIAGFIALITAHNVSPTSMAGLGLDLFVIIVFFFGILFLVIKGLADPLITEKDEKLIGVIQVIGFALLMGWICFA